MRRTRECAGLSRRRKCAGQQNSLGVSGTKTRMNATSYFIETLQHFTGKLYSIRVIGQRHGFLLRLTTLAAKLKFVPASCYKFRLRIAALNFLDDALEIDLFFANVFHLLRSFDFALNGNGACVSQLVQLAEDFFKVHEACADQHFLA